MTEYVVLNVLLHHRRTALYLEQQLARVWQEQPQPAAAEVTVGPSWALGSWVAMPLRFSRGWAFAWWG